MSGALTARLVVRRSEEFLLDVEIDAAPGETVAVLGPNGAGKSTAVAAMAGLLPIDAGRISLGPTVWDDPVAEVFMPAEKRNVGVVFQDYMLFPHLTVMENVAFGLRSRGVPRTRTLQRAGVWLERLGLAELADDRPRDLSGGEAQRVALGRALVTEPDLLLLDEPLAALDVTTRAEMRRTIGEHLAGFDGPRVLITHDATEAFLLADEVHIIEGGVVTQHGDAEEIRLRPATSYAADLAGANLISATVKEGKVLIGGRTLHVASEVPDGPVLLTIHPTAISVHATSPGGSPRNTWKTEIDRVERLGMRVRLHTGGPPPLTAEVTETARSELGLRPGLVVWVAIKATEIGIRSDLG